MTQHAVKHATRALKVVVKHHNKIVRVTIFVVIVCAVVVTHESGLSLLAIGYKALEMFADVVADRVFPSEWVEHR
jgi:hypothetical protein